MPTLAQCLGRVYGKNIPKAYAEELLDRSQRNSSAGLPKLEADRQAAQEVLDTVAAELKDVLNQLGVADPGEVLPEQEPFARRRPEEFGRGIKVAEIRSRLSAAGVPFQPTKDDLKRMSLEEVKANRDKMGRLWEEARAVEDYDEAGIFLDEYAKYHTELKKRLEYINAPPVEPFARRKPITPTTPEEFKDALGLYAPKRPGRPRKERPLPFGTDIKPGQYEEVTPTKLSDLAGEIIASPTLAEVDVKAQRGIPVKAEPTMLERHPKAKYAFTAPAQVKQVYQKPSMELFLKEARRRFGPLEENQLVAAWKDAKQMVLDEMSGEELELLRTKLRVTSVGQRKIADPLYIGQPREGLTDPRLKEAAEQQMKRFLSEAGVAELERIASNKDKLAARLRDDAEKQRLIEIRQPKGKKPGELFEPMEVEKEKSQLLIQRAEKLEEESARLRRTVAEGKADPAKYPGLPVKQEELGGPLEEKTFKFPKEGKPPELMDVAGLEPEDVPKAIRFEAARRRAWKERTRHRGVIPQGAPTPTGPRLTAQQRSAQAYRQTAIRAISQAMDKGVGKEVKPREGLERPVISADEIMTEADTRYGVFRSLTGSEATNPDVLADILRDNPRVGEKENINHTRRLVAMVEPKSGVVHLVSSYPTGARVTKWKKIEDPRTGTIREVEVKVPAGESAKSIRIMDPRKTRFEEKKNTQLPDVMKVYRPFETFVIREPVMDFHQKFDSVAEYNTFIGDEARLKSEEAFRSQQAMEEKYGSTAQGMTPRYEGEGQTGLRRTRLDEVIDEAEWMKGTGFLDYMAERRNKPLELFEAEEMMRHLDSFEGDPRAALTDLVDNPKADVLLAYDKIYEAIRRRPEAKDLTERQLLDQMLEEIYAERQRATTAEEFARFTVDRYAGGTKPLTPLPSAAGTYEPTSGGITRELTARERAPIETQPMHVTYAGDVIDPRTRAMDPGELFKGIGVEYGAPWFAKRPGPKGLKEGREWREYIRHYTEFVRRQMGEKPGPPTREEWEDFAKKYADQIREAEPSAEPFARLTRKQRRNAVLARDIVSAIPTAFHRYYSQWLTEVIRENGKEGAAEAADFGNQSIDRAKAIYGELTPLLDPAKEAAGGSVRVPIIGQAPNPAAIKRLRWLHQLTHPVSKETGMANVVGAIENWLKAPANLKNVIDLARALNLEVGRRLQKVVEGFLASGMFQRIMTPFGFDMFAEGEGHPNWKSYTRDTAILNLPFLNDYRKRFNQNLIRQNAKRAAKGLPPVKMQQLPMLTPKTAIKYTRKFFNEWRDELNKPAKDSNRIFKIQQDFHRQFPRVLTHVRTLSGWQEVIHTNLFNYLEQTSQRAAHTIAFREKFPNTLAGRTAFAQLDAKVRSELPGNIRPYWDSLVKSLQGRPTDDFSKLGIVAPGRPTGEAVRILNQTAMGLLRKLALTGQMVTQLPETAFGSGLAEFGMANRFRALARAGALWAEIEKRGQINRLMYDWSMDPSSPARSLFRFTNNVISKFAGENVLNEIQGKLGALEALVVSERIANQNTVPLTRWEKRQLPETFRKMGFTPEEVTKIMAGDARLLAMMERRAPAWISAENKHAAEGSIAGTRRVLNALMPFQMYPQMKLNQFRANYRRLGEAIRSGDWRQIRNAGEGMVRFLGFTGIQGAGYALLASLLFGGPMGLKVKSEEASDELGWFMLDSFSAALGGPYYLLWQGARRAGLTGVGEQLTRTVFPYAQAAEANDAWNGYGPYHDLTPGARLGKYLLNRAPAGRILRQTLATVGLTQTDIPLEQSISAFHRWSRDTMGFDESNSKRKNDERKAFREGMMTAVNALKRGDMEGYQEGVYNAIIAGVEAPTDQEIEQRIAASLRGRKILKNINGGELTPEQMESLRDRIGEDAVDRLLYYDALLEAMASGM